MLRQIVLLMCLFLGYVGVSHSVDVQIAAFITGKALRLAETKQFLGAYKEVAWMLDDATGKSEAKRLFSQYPEVANAVLDSLGREDVIAKFCGSSEWAEGKSEVSNTILRVAKFAEDDRLAKARETLDAVSSEFESRGAASICGELLAENVRRADETEVALVVEANKNAPRKIRELDNADFCEKFGQVLRKDTPSEFQRVRTLEKLFESDATRRKISVNKQLVISEKIRIGISTCTLYAAWGLPTAENRSVGSWGVHIQHIYRGQGVYVYSENGRISSWQD